MHHTVQSVAAAALIVGSSSTALANTLIIEPTSANLVPVSFEYRFDAARKWLGCFQYDVLQGSGWYPGAWYHTANFTPVDGEYEAEFSRTWTERYCAATMGIYNYVQIEWTNPNDPSEVYHGVMQIDAGGSQPFDEVTCKLADPSSPWNAIECQTAAVSFSGKGDATILINLVGLE